MASIGIHAERQAIFGAFEFRTGAVVGAAILGANLVGITDFTAFAALIAGTEHGFAAIRPVVVAIVIAVGANIASCHVMCISIHAIRRIVRCAAHLAANARRHTLAVYAGLTVAIRGAAAAVCIGFFQIDFAAVHPVAIAVIKTI